MRTGWVRDRVEGPKRPKKEEGGHRGTTTEHGGVASGLMGDSEYDKKKR